MRILLIHAEKFWWKVKQPARISVRDKLIDENKEFEASNVLVAFIAVERKDEGELEKTCRKAVDAIIEVSGRIGVKTVILYPYAHLSTNLSKPQNAVKALRIVYELLKSREFEVYKSPFGYYKEFILHCKGHPLAESLRVI